MTNLIKLTTIALTAIVATTSIASAMILPVPRVPRPHLHQNHTLLGVECRVKDNDFWIINWGNTNLDSGRVITWRSPTTGDQGEVLLPKMLAPGEEVKLFDVLSDEA